MVDKQDLIGYPVDERKNMGGEENGDAVAAKGAQHCANSDGGDGIDTFERFVEE